MAFQPFDSSPKAWIIDRDSVGNEADNNLPCPVDVIDAPATVPAEIGLLILKDEIESSFVDVTIGSNTESCEAFQNPCGDIRRAWINHGIMIGERHFCENFTCIVSVKRTPTAVFALHGFQPADAATHGAHKWSGRF